MRWLKQLASGSTGAASQVSLSGNIEMPLDLEKKLRGGAFTVQLPRAPSEGSEASGST